MLANLSDLIASHAEVAFRARAVRAVRGIGATASLLPWETIEALKGSSRIPAEDYYLGFHGGAVPRAAYRKADGMLRPDVVQAFIAKGANLVFDKIARHVPAVAAVADGIAQQLGAAVGVNAYLSFGSVSVFKPHCDPHDVLAVHIHGAKRWRLYGAHEAGVPKTEEVLQSGDLLFVPRGEMHDAVPLELPCVHLSFGIAANSAPSNSSAVR